MFILDNQATTETLPLDRVLRGWWARMWAWLRPLPPEELLVGKEDLDGGPSKRVTVYRREHREG